MSESSPDLVAGSAGPLMQEHGASPLTSLVVLSSSRPATAATSQMTIVPNDDDDDESDSSPRNVHEDAHPASDDLTSSSSPSAPTEQPTAAPQIPQITLNFLLASGTRKVMSFDGTTSVARVKELVWNAWQSDWQEEKPPSPNYLWVVRLGKVLQDDNTLEELSFPSWTSPGPATTTVVHLWIRNAPPPTSTDEGSLKKKVRRATLRATASVRQVPGVGAAARAQGATAGAGATLATAGGEHGSGCCAGCVIC